jgi:ABC-type phosphate transport system ATPase subunit
MFYNRHRSVLRWEEKVFSTWFFSVRLLLLDASLFLTFMQRLALDATEMVELQEEVTRAQVTVVVAGVRATQAERMAQEKAVLLATARGEMDEVAQSASILEDELMVAR